MRRRYTYVLLFALPAALAAAIASAFVLGAAAGAMWIFIYGDNPWPASAETALAVLAGLAFVVVLTNLLFIAFRVGRAEEQRAQFNPAHLRLAAASAALLVLAVVAYQWNVGNVGPRSDEAVCADFCTLRRFNASSMPPRNSGLRTCSCMDAKGQAAVTAPIEEAAAELKAARK